MTIRQLRAELATTDLEQRGRLIVDHADDYDLLLHALAHKTLTPEQVAAAQEELCDWLERRDRLECGTDTPREVGDGYTTYDAALDYLSTHVDDAVTLLLHGWPVACTDCAATRTVARRRKPLPGQTRCAEHLITSRHPEVRP